MSSENLHSFWWLWIPVVAIVLQGILEISLPHQVLAVLHSETGPHELAQFILAAAGFIVAVRILLLPSLKGQKFLYAWVGIAALGCLYIAGEELSWGQHFLEWNTPEYWAVLNDQGETNLHNTSSWLDQKPRMLLEIGVLVGGIIVPLLIRFKPKVLKKIPQKFHVIFPPSQLMVIAVIALMINVVDKIDDATAGSIMQRASEVEELYLFYFVLLYLVALKRRLVLQD